MNSVAISKSSRILIALSSIFLLISIYVPIWRIELSAPQYPEGMELLIYSNHLGGQVDIINGLNHYIGMKTLHANEFVEFTILPYIIGFFALFCLFVVAVPKRTLLIILLFLFIAFGILAMVDFWIWEYDYGHNLDPKAAIIVPGMAYQPPLIGYKQLLNFGVYSVPAFGGWLFIFSGLMMLVSVLLEMNWLPFFKKSMVMLFGFCMLAFSVSCQSENSEPIKLNKDNCDYCKMTIADGHFASEFKTSKGRYYKFDDLGCLLNFKSENPEMNITKYYINEYTSNNSLIEIQSSYIAFGEEIQSPMSGNYAAFSSKADFQNFLKKTNAVEIKWSDLIK